MNAGYRGAGHIVLAGLICVSGISCDSVRSMFGKKSGAGQGVRKNDAAIVIGEQAPLLEGPAANGALISTLSLGETVYAEGESRDGEQGSGVRYMNVRLSDGTTGWVRQEFLVVGAQAGAIMAPVRLHQRPDSLTMTDRRLEFMDMVAVVAETDQWLEVIGKQRRTQGWIRKGVATRRKEDVANAVYARKKLIQEGTVYDREQLNEIIFNAPYPDSYFVRELRLLASLLSMADEGQTMQPEAPPEAEEPFFAE
jgi:hypothetical protein